MERKVEVYIRVDIVSIVTGIPKKNRVPYAHTFEVYSMAFYDETKNGEFAFYYQPFGLPDGLVRDIYILKKHNRPSSFEKFAEVPVIDEDTNKTIKTLKDVNVIEILEAVKEIQKETPMCKRLKGSATPGGRAE
jgi:hypothetical protein